MTVSELIKELSKYDGNLEVYSCRRKGNGYYAIDGTFEDIVCGSDDLCDPYPWLNDGEHQDIVFITEA